MKIRSFVMVILLGILLMAPLACMMPQGSPKPVVGDVPQGWSISNEEPYGTYTQPDGTMWGLVEYSAAGDSQFVQIYYGPVPPDMEDWEINIDLLVDRAILESTMFQPEETGTMLVGEQIMAGYTKAYDPDEDRYQMEIVFVLESACIDIWTSYNTDTEAQAMAIINSISVQ